MTASAVDKMRARADEICEGLEVERSEVRTSLKGDYTIFIRRYDNNVAVHVDPNGCVTYSLSRFPLYGPLDTVAVRQGARVTVKRARAWLTGNWREQQKLVCALGEKYE